MTHYEANKRHDQLVEDIRRYDYAYYVDGNEIVTDFEYDQIFQELLNLEKCFPKLVTGESPSRRIGGAPMARFNKIRHRQPMLSLEKIEASEKPDWEEEPDRERRNRLQDQNTVDKFCDFDAGICKLIGKEKVEYILEPKVDGVSISVHYQRGKLILGATRGGITSSGEQEGDDITANIRTLKAIPLQLNMKNPPALLEVRGEAFIATNDFKKLNARLVAEGLESFPNARNATAGALKQLDSRLVAQRPISAVFYAVGLAEGINFSTHAEMLEVLKSFGLPTQPIWWICKGVSEVIRTYNDEVVSHYDEQRDLRTKVPYEIDGIVIKVNRLAEAKLIPAKTRAPGDAIVHKPIPWITPAETRLNSITIQVGRTGVLTPVAELEPVFVQGSTISRATLHNEDEIRRKGIRIGDTVVVRKAGMVIPEVLEVLKTKRPKDSVAFDFQKHTQGKCPACGGPIAKEKVSAGDKAEVAWRCQNVAGCPAQKSRRIEYFAQRKALDIESLGGIVADKLVERGLVNEPLDLFDLKLEPLAKLNLGTDDEPRTFGEKNATKILDALKRAKTAPLSRWIYALAIHNVGEATAFQLANLHADMDALKNSQIISDYLRLKDLIEEAKQVNPDATKVENKVSGKDEKDKRTKLHAKLNSQIEEIASHLKGVGVKLEVKGQPKKYGKPPLLDIASDLESEACQSIQKFFASDYGRRTVVRMTELGIKPSSKIEKPSASPSPISGMTVVLTGTLPTLSRDEASALIRNAGGNVAGSVSKNTDFLLAGEEAGSKMEKAKELGVKILSEKDFLDLLGSKPKPSQKQQSELL